MGPISIGEIDALRASPDQRSVFSSLLLTEADYKFITTTQHAGAGENETAGIGVHTLLSQPSMPKYNNTNTLNLHSHRHKNPKPCTHLSKIYIHYKNFNIFGLVRFIFLMFFFSIMRNKSLMLTKVAFI